MRAPVPGNLDPKKEWSLRSGPQSCYSPGSLLGPQRKKPPCSAGQPWGTVQHGPGGIRPAVLRREAPRGTCRSCCSHRSPSEGAAYPYAEHSCCWSVLPIGTLVLNHRARQIARVELRLPSPFERNCDSPADRPLASDLGGSISQGPSGQQARPAQGSAPLFPSTLAQFVHTRPASELRTS